MASSIYFTIKIPEHHPELLKESAWEFRSKSEENRIKYDFVRKVYELKDWYVDELQTFLETNFKLKVNRRKGRVRRKALSIGLKAFLSMTYFGQLAYSIGQFAGKQGLGFTMDMLNPLAKKKLEFDIFSMLENFGCVYNAGQRSVTIKPRWKYWELRAKWMEFGNSNAPKTFMLSKTNIVAEKKWKEINR
jgi:hypothetical protein